MIHKSKANNEINAVGTRVVKPHKATTDFFQATRKNDQKVSPGAFPMQSRPGGGGNAKMPEM